MAFLIPALLACFLDLLLLYLSFAKNAHLIGPTSSIYSSSYLVPLSILRLLLLFTVLPYHSYTGTAVKCPVLYRLFFGGTLVTVVLHMLLLSMIDPNSLKVWTPGRRILFHPHHDDDFYQRRRIWLLLTFSCASSLCHLIMLQHVTSTAPDQASALDRRRQILLQQRRKSQPLFYYASRRWNQQQGQTEHPERGALLPNHTNGNGNHHHHDNDADLRRNQWQQGDGNGEANHIMDRISAQSYEFVMDLQSKLQIAKRQWAQRLEDFSSKITSPNNGATTNDASHAYSKIRRAGSANRLNHALSPLTPFRVLLQLFAYEEVLDNGRLDAVFFADDGDSMTFFVPQLLNFLLYGAYETGSFGLEDWILDKCRRNAFFAHRCFWYLRAWCLHLPAQLAPTPKRESSQPSLLSASNCQLQKLSDSRMQRSMSNGSLAVKNFLRGGDDCTANMEDSLSAVSVHSYSSRGGSKSQNNGNNQQEQQQYPNLLPEERAVIEALMFRVMECGEESARILQYGATPNVAERDEADNMERNHASTLDAPGPPQIPSFHSAENSSAGPFSPSDIMMAAESGSIPVDPNTGYPSVKHLDVLCASQKFGFLPLLHSKSSNGTSHSRQKRPPVLTVPPVVIGGASAPILRRLSHDDESPDMESWFEATPRFLDALIALADNLLLTPREKRQEELRKQLQSLEVELLPSNAIYVPVNNTHHRVWRIVAEESIALSTKERVPCIVCLEVVNYTPCVQAAPKRQSILEKVKTSLRSSSKPQSDLLGTGASVSEDESASTHSLPFLPTGPSHITEKEIVYQWRTERRDPHRGESIIGKVTHSVREGINKIPLDSVRETMTKISDPRAIHDMLHMTSADFETGKSAKGKSADEEDGDRVGATRASETKLSNDIESGVVSGEKPSVFAGSQASRKVATEPLAGAPTTPVPRTSNRVVPPSASMGQWLTPSPGRTLVSHPNGLQSLVTIRRKMESLKDSDRISPYGATTDVSRKGSIPPRSTKSNEVGASSLANRALAVPTVKPPPVVFKECWKKKEERVRAKSAYGSHPGWRLLPVLIKSNDDLRQEQLAYQLIYRMAYILAREKVPVWLCPYEIIALTDRGGIIEAIPDTISLDSLRRNDPEFNGLKSFFRGFFGEDTDEYADAKANFVESLAAYSIVCFLLQIKDRHNGNILLDNRGHLVHIDFGFFFLSSPGKNSGFESAPFKLTRDFVDLLDGPDSRAFRTFRELCARTFLALRRHCDEIILLVEMMMNGNEDLKCFRGRPEDAVRGLRERFRLDLNDRACVEYVNFLVEESMENWRTDWYDRYQRYCVGIL